MLTAQTSLPQPLCQAASIISEAATTFDTRPIYVWEEICGFYMRVSSNLTFGECLNNEDLKQGRSYPRTPAEFLGIGNYGDDGAQAGFIVRTPEVEQSEYPAASYCEIDMEGVRFAGRDSSQFIENHLSSVLRGWLTMGQDVEAWRRQGIEDPEGFARTLRENAQAKQKKYAPLTEKLSSALNIHPTADRKVIGFRGEYQTLPTPEVPAGWRFEPTHDGIGVLAPEKFFDAAFSADLVTGDNIRAARLLMRRGFPATALWLLKQLAWNHREERELAMTLNEMSAAYTALNRPILADAIRVTLSYI
jgi:hypothetical protein